MHTTSAPYCLCELLSKTLKYSCLGGWFVSAQVRQQVSVEPLPAELEVVTICGQKNQLSSLVHGSQAKAILHEGGSRGQ